MKHWDTSARAHAQMRPTNDLWDMHRYLVSNRTPTFVASAEPFLSDSLAIHFDILHAARATCLADPPNEPNPVAVNFY